MFILVISQEQINKQKQEMQKLLHLHCIKFKRFIRWIGFSPIPWICHLHHVCGLKLSEQAVVGSDPQFCCWSIFGGHLVWRLWLSIF